MVLISSVLSVFVAVGTGVPRAMRYFKDMATLRDIFKYIVTAFAVLAMVSMPAAALDEGRLDRLYAQLLDSPPDEAAVVAAAIADEWAKSGSPTVDLLLKRGFDAMDAGDYLAAIDHFTAVVDHAPDFAESYSGRAAAYYLTGRIGPAIDDLRQALVLNPRQFIAMRGFAVILEELGRDAEALEVYKRVLALHPSEPDTLAAVDRLEQKLAGQSL